MAMSNPTTPPNRQSRSRTTNNQVTSLKRITSPQRVNDDANEKRKRRQSIIDDRRRRMSLLSPRPSPIISNISVQEPTPVTKLPSVEVMNKHFEEWMKIAADNKINASNSWDLALIDYFHDMKILKDGDSINFQKASCTLDGCVKIYSSRVDSVATETGKLLSGLLKNNNNKTRTDDKNDDENELEERATRRRGTRRDTTLEKDINNLNVKKFDLEFSVDPLFKKTCADFDEGGARGLLLNHLGINENGMIIFDASDAIEDEDIDGDDIDSQALNQENKEENLIDISALKDKFLLNMDDIMEYDICPSLKSFEFSSDAPLSTTMLSLQRINEENLKASEEEIKNDNFDDDNDIEEIFPNLINVDGINNDDDPIEVNDVTYILNNTVKNVHAIEDEDDHKTNYYEKNENEKNFDENCCELYNNADSIDEDKDNLFSYFDTTLIKNWAGPNHWRLRPIKEKTNNSSEKQVSQDQPIKKSNKTFTIDFINGEDISEEELFEKVENVSNLPSSMKKNNNILPKDSHFSSHDFLKLFLKPNVIVKFKKSRSSEDYENEDEYLDEAFWADHKDDSPIFEDSNPITGLANAENENVGIMDNTTYFYNDDDDDEEEENINEEESPDDPAVTNNNEILKDDVIDVDMGNYGEQLVAKPKKIKSLAINYARSAKRVDVKKLKDNIWKELSTKSSTTTNKLLNKEMEDEEDDEHVTPRKEHEIEIDDDEDENTLQREFKFTEIVGGLKDMYQEKNLKDISVAFCFICLLHLANEKDLEIVSDGSLTELSITQNK